MNVDEKGIEDQNQILVYFLQNDRKSYIGYTVNLHRRLRQHKGEIKGGAKCTTGWQNRDNTELVAFIRGFPDQRTAMSYEWHAKRRRSQPKTKFLGLDPPCHARFCRFFIPLTNNKFAACKPGLQVVLVKHHELLPVIQTSFQMPNCITVQDDVTPFINTE